MQALSKDPTEFIQECKLLSYQELEELSLELRGSALSIEGQLNHAKLHPCQDDQEWLTRSSMALNWTRWRHSVAQTMLTQKRRESRTIGDLFIDTARALLPKDTFYMLLNEAKSQQGQQQGVPS